MNALFAVKSARADVLSILLKSNDMTVLKPALEEHFARFDDIRTMPFLLDIQQLPNPQDVHFDEILSLFKELKLNLIGMRHPDKSYAALADKCGLAFNPLPENSMPLPATEEQTGTVIITEATLMIDKPVRSGQQIYAKGRDVICTALVSQGAEVIADGNIHIYAPLRGRALAGASGARNARIFTQSMQAQLVSVAGIYRTFERQLPDSLNGKAVCIALQDEKLNITALSNN